MLSLFLSSALRNFNRDKTTTGIQIVGLVIGIACFLIIQKYVAFQYSFNTQFTDAESTYRIDLIRDSNRPQTLTPLRLAEELKTNFSEVLDVTRISATSVSVKHGASVYSERPVFVDANYFSFFDFELIEGDIHTALNAPNSIVLHELQAEKYFGNSMGIIGNRLSVNGKDYQITAVIKDTQSPTTIPKTLLIPMEGFYDVLPNIEWTRQWNFNATITFAKLNENTDLKQLANRVSEYYDQRAEGLSSFKSYRVLFESLRTINLNNETTRPLVPASSLSMVQAFEVIALLILGLACINFTNLATAAALKRGKSVAVAKALGASKTHLISQYLFEALLLSFFAMCLALVVAFLVLPIFNGVMNVTVALSLDVKLILQLCALTVLIAFVSGSYPAFFLSSLSPTIVLKGLLESSKGGMLFRKVLIVAQFGVASFLLVSSMIVTWQMQHVQEMSLGYQKDNIIVVNRGADIYDSFKARAERHPDVEAITMSHTVPTKATRTSNMLRLPDDINNEIWVASNPVSLDYFKTYGIKLISGRAFDKQFVNDAYVENQEDMSATTGKLIINETLARRLGWSPETALSQTVMLGNINDGIHAHQIVGVTEDTHYVTAKTLVPPMIYVLSAQPEDLSLRWTSIRFKEGADINAIQEVEAMWLAVSRDQAFKFDWLTDLFSDAYRNENQQMALLSGFSSLAIMITVIGLFGIAAFSAQRRVKELAVRKVLGASVAHLCGTQLKQFLQLVLVANVVVLPVAYIIMQDWLNGYVYRIDMPTVVFALALVTTLGVATLTVLSIAYRAASSNPIENLRAE